MKILLTGSNGFIGSNLYEKFCKNNELYLIIRNKKKTNKKIYSKIIYFKNYKELNKKLKKIKVNLVIHTATHYKKNHTFNDLKKFNESNLYLGNIILENLNTMGVKKFINFSTVWEDYDGIKNNFFNLYAVYKNSFTNLINYYKKKNKKIKFFNIMISDTFGKNDNREKIINTLKDNYKKKKITKIISKNLYLNLLNVEDITRAINMIKNQNLKSGQYLLKNTRNIKIFNLIKKINESNEKKIFVKWQSKKTIKNKIYSYKKLIGWKPVQSSIANIINLIIN